MPIAFTELDRRPTPMGDISLRRRRELTLDVDVFEVKLGDEFLMSSLFTVAERALATLGLGAVEGAQLDVVVGGLGLGYTARAVLADPRVRSVHVVDALEAVIDWHRQLLLPLSDELTADGRCHLVHGDFFAMVASAGPLVGREHLDAILVDIDHTPRHVLHRTHTEFYTRAGLKGLAARLRIGGVFGLWSDDPPDDDFMAILADVFPHHEAHVVAFANPYTSAQSANTVYLATT
ncbi:MAG: spermidine synthase [Acidimicrobiia bacterium]|nr:spermidine synthase [Acidimicrobiia bacterium]